MEERIKQLEEQVEVLQFNVELLLGVISRLKLNGESLYSQQLNKMIRERN